MTIHSMVTPSKSMATPFVLSKTSSYSNGQVTPKTTIQTFSESNMQEIIQRAETIITKWNLNKPSSTKFTSLLQENRNAAHEFMRCVDELRSVMHFLISQHSSSNKLVLANKLMKIAMLRLAKEFSLILSSEKQEYSFGFDKTFNIDDEFQKPELISQSMISSGYSKECVEIYKTTRKSIVEEKLHQLWKNQTSPESIEHQVKKWINAVKFAVGTLFNGERILCDRVFAASETMNQTCIAHVIMEGATNLFKFPEVVIAKSKKSPEKIFILTNMFEAIHDLTTDIESIFSYESLSPIKLQAFSSLQKLKESIQSILCVFISSIQKNSSKKPVPGGGIHPLTCSVMDYVSSLAENSEILSEILTTDDHQPLPACYFDSLSSNSTLASRFAWIILMLLCKLDSKAKLYNDVALSYLFLANNLQYVIESVNTNNSLNSLIGEDWSCELEKKLKIYANNYESVAWGNVFSCLESENLNDDSSSQAIKRRFRKFESAFNEAYQKQRLWVIPNMKLRDEIKVSIERKLVAAYRGFYYSNLAMFSGENLDMVSPDNLGDHLWDLFYTTDADAVSVIGSSSSCLCAPAGKNGKIVI